MTRAWEALQYRAAQRRRLVGDLRHAPRWALGVSGAGLLLGALLPSVAAVSLGALADRLADASVVSPLMVLLVSAVVIGSVGGHVLDQFLDPVREFAQDRITEGVRADARSLMLDPVGVEGYDDQQTLTDAFTLSRGLGTWSYGLGVEGQLANVAWGFERLLPTLVVGLTFSWWLGVFVAFVAVAGHRFLLHFYEVGAIEVVVPQQAEQRELRYWAHVVGGARGGKEVRTFGFGPWATAHQRAVATRMHQRSFAYVLSILPRQWPAFVLGAVGLAVPLLVVRDRLLDGSASPGSVATMLAAVVAAYTASGGEEPFAYVAARHVDEARERLRAAAQDVMPAAPVCDVTAVGGDIRLHDVTFRYPGSETDVLFGCDLEIRRGETLAVVGANGAGKSTLIKLLSGMYQPTSGRVTVAGKDIRDVGVDRWRQQLAVVFQDFVRFELSVAENVGLADIGQIDRQRVRSAVETALDADDVEEELDDLLTRRFEGGTELSGGEWQRVLLARGIYSLGAGRDVLIMDEPTASLDVRGELRMFKSRLRGA